ncbi:MAG: arginyltransferase [Planctomycetota bacterium]|nr:MAG: arginyltransferase [Planctomycetota bacterium]
MSSTDFLVPLMREPEPCPYLQGEVACMPLYFPRRKLDGAEVDKLWELGYRRAGHFFYQTACAACQACQPIRVPVDRFRASRTQRRVWSRGQREIEMRLDAPRVEADRVALINKHRQIRGLAHDRKDLDDDDYAAFLVHRACLAIEFSYWYRDRLIGIAILDQGETSCSAVYTYFDPDFARYSPGTYSILAQIDYCRRTGAQWLYLGYFIADNPHMRYKTRFRPYQLLIDGTWTDFCTLAPQA